MGFSQSFTCTKKIIKYDLINKFLYKNVRFVSKLKNITLNFGCKNFDTQKFTATLLALEVLTLKKTTLSISRNPNVLLKIQKGQPAGCKVNVGGNDIDSLLIKLNLEILPKLKNTLKFKNQTEISTFSFKFLPNEIVLQELEDHYPLFLGLPSLDINVLTNSQNHKELIFLIKSMKVSFFKRDFSSKNSWISGREV